MEEGTGSVYVQVRTVGKLAKTVTLAGESLNSNWPEVAVLLWQRGVGLLNFQLTPLAIARRLCLPENPAKRVIRDRIREFVILCFSVLQKQPALLKRHAPHRYELHKVGGAVVDDSCINIQYSMYN